MTFIPDHRFPSVAFDNRLQNLIRFSVFSFRHFLEAGECIFV
jgi:hypothetical protein